MNNRRMISRFLKVCVGVAFVLPFSMATSPTPPPYHQYTVHGVLERPLGGSKKDFAVVLQAKFRHSIDTGFQTLRGMLSTTFGEIPVGLTDSTGNFHVRVSSSEKADSLRLAVVVPDRPLTVGTPFSTSGFQAIPNYETYESESQPGCSGCRTDSETSSRITFYSYYIENRTITISF